MYWKNFDSYSSHAMNSRCKCLRTIRYPLVILTAIILACTAPLLQAGAEKVNYEALGKSVWNEYMNSKMPAGMKKSMQEMFKKNPARAYEALGRIFANQVDEVQKTFKEFDRDCRNQSSSKLLRCMQMTTSDYCEMSAWKFIIAQSGGINHPAVQWNMTALEKRAYEVFLKKEEECIHPKIKTKHYLIGGGSAPLLFQKEQPRMPGGHKLVFKLHRADENNSGLTPRHIRARIETVRAHIVGLNDCEKKKFQLLTDQKQCSRLSDAALAADMKLVGFVNNKLNAAYDEWKQYRKETAKHAAAFALTGQNPDQSADIRHRRKIQQRLLEKWNALHKKYVLLQKDYETKRKLTDKCWGDSRREAKENCVKKKFPAARPLGETGAGNKKDCGKQAFRDLTGRYTSGLTLRQSGQSVSGTYAGGKGKIQGKVDGDKLVGTFIRSDYSPPIKGRFEFRFSKDKRSFTGHWKNTSIDGSGAWNGRRLDNCRPAEDERGKARLPAQRETKP